MDMLQQGLEFDQAVEARREWCATVMSPFSHNGDGWLILWQNVKGSFSNFF